LHFFIHFTITYTFTWSINVLLFIFRSLLNVLFYKVICSFRLTQLFVPIKFRFLFIINKIINNWVHHWPVFTLISIVIVLTNILTFQSWIWSFESNLSSLSRIHRQTTLISRWLKVYTRVFSVSRSCICQESLFAKMPICFNRLSITNR
jgi:hypothetical protein